MTGPARHEPVAVPALDEFAPGVLARLGSMDAIMVAVGLQRLDRTPGRQRLRGIALPAFELAADIADLDMRMPLGERAEGPRPPRSIAAVRDRPPAGLWPRASRLR